MALIETIRAAALPWGLNLVAAVSATRYNARASNRLHVGTSQESGSVILIGNGGGAFWQSFVAYADAHPGWRARANPLDDFTRVAIEQGLLPAIGADGVRAQPFYPFVTDSPTLDFMELGKLTGLGGPSLVGVVVHPVYGPWIAFRAALLVDQLIDAPGDALGFDPCPGCGPRSCITACPAQAVSSSGWDIPRCVTHRVEREPDCNLRCHARAACVLGPEYRYADDELAYHQMRALGAMRPYYEKHLRPARSHK
jgi:hypothetical protein